MRKILCVMVFSIMVWVLGGCINFAPESGIDSGNNKGMVMDEVAEIIIIPGYAFLNQEKKGGIIS